MLAFLGTSYGAILVVWGLVFEVAGFALMWVVYRATQREERKIIRAEDLDTSENESRGAIAVADQTAGRREPSPEREGHLVN
jgi:hypothetical protein